MQQPQEETKTTTPADPAKDERVRILTQVLENRDKMIATYTAQVKHTGSLVSTSMAYAYNKAIKDILKLIAKGAKNEETA